MGMNNSLRTFAHDIDEFTTVYVIASEAGTATAASA